MKKLQILEGNDKHSNGSFLPPAERDRLRKQLFEEFTDMIIDIKATGNGVNLDDLTLCLFCLLKIIIQRFPSAWELLKTLSEPEKADLKKSLPLRCINLYSVDNRLIYIIIYKY